jgi:hypothetical protein
MKAKITIIILSLLFTGIMVEAQTVNDLSTLGKKPDREIANLPRLTPYMPSLFMGETRSGVTPVELSTLGKKNLMPRIEPRMLGSSIPITVTPSFSIRNQNLTAGANTVYTMPQALASSQINYLNPNVTVYTPPIAIFGGA